MTTRLARNKRRIGTCKLERSAPSADVKRRYRDLVREYHPDRHIAAGVPEEMIEIATERLQKVNEAYEQIMAERAG